MGLIPSINVPSSITGTGTLARNQQVLASHIFNAGLEKPEILEALLIKFPNFYLTDLTDKIAGVSQTIFSDTYSWILMDRTRKSGTITAISNGTTATATLTLDITADGVNDLGYFIVGDTFRVADTGMNGIVTAVGNSGGFQTIQVQRYDGANWATATINTNNKIGHIGTGFARGSAGSGGVRSYLPTYDYNTTEIHRRGFKIERGVMAQKTYVDNDSWYFHQEDFEQKEFMRDFEAMLVFGKRFKGAVGQTRGLMEYAEGSGQSVTFSSGVGVQEADWSQLLQQLYPQQGSSDLIALCGEKILFDTNHALGSRYRELPQQEKPRELSGLNFQSYEIAGKRVHFAYYELFSDSAVVPVVTPSSTAKDFRNTALVLDFGMVTGANGSHRNIEVLYRDGAKFIQKMIPGMASPGLEVSNAYDGLQGELLTEFTTAVYMPNRLGLVYANS